MNKAPEWTVVKWPFVLVYIVLLIVAAGVLLKSQHPISPLVILGIIVCVVVGSIFACLPFIMEYRATSKLLEVNSVGTVADQLGDLKQYADQIAAATSQWASVQETTRGHADKTVTAAREVAQRMTDEIREFNEFQAKLNDTEKAALRLEVDKLRRAETEWVQVLVRILDHIFAFNNAAVRSGNADLAEQTGNFQNACRDAARRVGLAGFIAAAGENFETPKHRAHGVEQPPPDAIVGETLAPGMTYQGRLIRPALVRLQESSNPPVVSASEPAVEIAGGVESAEPETVPAPAKAPVEMQPAKQAPPESGDFALE